jgi:hypothetical protein
MNRLAIALLAVTLSGCASLEAKLENVPLCSLTHDRAFVASMYGPIGISSEITPRYVKAMCAQLAGPLPAAR